MSWKQIELGRAIHVKHGFAFKGEHFVDEGEFIVLTPGNFYEAGGFRVRPGKDRAYAGDVPDDYVLNENDLIVAMTEQGAGLLGSSALVPESNRYLHNQRLGLVDRIDAELLDRDFLYYLFNTREVRGQISGSATGTKVRHTAPERIYRVRVRVPDVTEQRTIAHTLSAYDNLIANNRRRIELLEQSSRLLFKEWFVNLRYPGHEHDKIVDWVPEGWKKDRVGELTTFISRGITPKYDDEADGMVINQKCIRDRFLDLVPARRQSKEVPANKLVRKGDVLINSTGEGTLGRVAQVLSEIESCTVDSHISIVRPKPQVKALFFGMSLAALEEFLAKQGRGSTNQTELSRRTIEDLKIMVPRPMLMEEFETVVEPIFSQLVALSKQNAKLGAARDLLLPRLMDGRLTV
jgi:type I restriction enzyme, S subunit